MEVVVYQCCAYLRIIADLHKIRCCWSACNINSDGAVQQGPGSLIQLENRQISRNIEAARYECRVVRPPGNLARTGQMSRLWDLTWFDNTFYRFMYACNKYRMKHVIGIIYSFECSSLLSEVSWHAYTVKSVCNDQLYKIIYCMWFIQ